MARGSLAEEIWQEAQDQGIHPEISLDARVRVGKDLCSDELAFVRRRKKFTARALASYLEIPEANLDPKDVPTIAVCGSGGGLRGTLSFLSNSFLICVTFDLHFELRDLSWELNNSRDLFHYPSFVPKEIF